MKQYSNKEGTPLAFHKFIWYFSLPVSFLTSISRMISDISEMPFFNWLYAVDFAYYIIALTLMLVCFVGFFGWKSYAWYGIITYLCFNASYSLYAVIIYAAYIPDALARAVGQLLGALVYATLVGIYYKKRRPLFFINTSEVNTGEHSAISNQVPLNPGRSDAPPTVKYCIKCGFELLNNSKFCSRCGAPIV